jgi:hypothetical protein
MVNKFYLNDKVVVWVSEDVYEHGKQGKYGLFIEESHLGPDHQDSQSGQQDRDNAKRVLFYNAVIKPFFFVVNQLLINF